MSSSEFTFFPARIGFGTFIIGLIHRKGYGFPKSGHIYPAFLVLVTNTNLKASLLSVARLGCKQLKEENQGNQDYKLLYAKARTLLLYARARPPLLYARARTLDNKTVTARRTLN